MPAPQRRPLSRLIARQSKLHVTPSRASAKTEEGETHTNPSTPPGIADLSHTLSLTAFLPPATSRRFLVFSLILLSSADDDKAVSVGEVRRGAGIVRPG
jgi:hypothetical protein